MFQTVHGGTADLVRWTLTDHLNSVHDIANYDPGTDMTSVVNHLAYGAFGNILSRRREVTPKLCIRTTGMPSRQRKLAVATRQYGAPTSPRADARGSCDRTRFNARPFGPATGLQNNLNRWYDSPVGRSLSENPSGFAPGG